MNYDEDTAGGLMNTDTITIRPDVTLDVVLKYLRLKKEFLIILTTLLLEDITII